MELAEGKAVAPAAIAPAAEVAIKVGPKLSFPDYIAQNKVVFDSLPLLTIAYKDVSSTVQVPEIEEGFDNIVTATWKAVTFANLFTKTKDFALVDNVSGILKPGTQTLIVAPPGHG